MLALSTIHSSSLVGLSITKEAGRYKQLLELRAYSQKGALFSPRPASDASFNIERKSARLPGVRPRVGICSTSIQLHQKGKEKSIMGENDNDYTLLFRLACGAHAIVEHLDI